MILKFNWDGKVVHTVFQENWYIAVHVHVLCKLRNDGIVLRKWLFVYMIYKIDTALIHMHSTLVEVLRLLYKGRWR